MSAPDYGSAVYAAWREVAADDWRAYTKHPFVEGLRDGTLDHGCFVHYLVQDYVFLKHFARAWAMAVVKSETLDEMKLAAGIVDGLINHEMQLHVQVCAREGIDEPTLFDAEEGFENLAYTRYVIDAGLGGDFLDLVAALAPCVLGYGEIGARLGASAVDGTRYREWIDTYADAEYQGLCESTGALIEAAAARRLGAVPMDSPRWSALCGRFTTATRLEIGFWEMGLRGAAGS